MYLLPFLCLCLYKKLVISIGRYNEIQLTRVFKVERRTKAFKVNSFLSLVPTFDI